MCGTPSPCDGVTGRRTRSTAKNGCHSQVVIRPFRYRSAASRYSGISRSRRPSPDAQKQTLYQKKPSIFATKNGKTIRQSSVMLGW
jgi:hypothetical protein